MYKNSRSTLGELWDSIKFWHESKRGKYGLETYLNILSEFTDRLIKEAEQSGLTYVGGECQIVNIQAEKLYDFHIKMYFQDKYGEQILKEARRKLPKDRFTSETEQMIGAGQRFEIRRPE